MKHLKKISLAKRNDLPDDVKVSLLNDQVKKHLFHSNKEYEELLAGKPAQTKPQNLLNRLWSGIEHYPDTKRQEAIKIIKKLDDSPSLQINDHLELVYNGDTLRGTNILQLIRAEVAANQGQRSLLPGQDLFYHTLLTTPSSSSSVPQPNVNWVVSPSPTFSKRKRASPSTSKSRKRLKSTLLSKSIRRTSDSPTKLRSYRLRSSGSKTNALLKESRWKK